MTAISLLHRAADVFAVLSSCRCLERVNVVQSGSLEERDVENIASIPRLELLVFQDTELPGTFAAFLRNAKSLRELHLLQCGHLGVNEAKDLSSMQKLRSVTVSSDSGVDEFVDEMKRRRNDVAVTIGP
jgi:hypothetical protein